MWEKAQDLSTDVTSIVQAPGDQSAYMVKSYSNKRPHYVKMSHRGSFLCDDQCLSYKSMKICSHIVALAIKQNCLTNLLKWYCTMKHIPNFTILAESGKPSTAGKKPMRKGITKRHSEQIQSIIAHAEEENPEWHTREESEMQMPSSNPSLCTSSVDSAAAYLQTMYEPHAPVASNSLQPSLAFCVDDSSPQYMSTYHQALQTMSTSTGPTLVMSQSVCGNTNTTGISYTIINSPPPLIPTCFPYDPLPIPPHLSSVSQQTQLLPSVDTPFWLVFVFGNVSRCNGCKGKIHRDENKKPLPPPGDIVLRHQEYVVFHNPRSGMFEQSREKRNVYYHPCRKCIIPCFRDFDPHYHIIIPDDVKQLLLSEHKNLMQQEFGFFC